MPLEIPTPTIQELKEARHRFEENEPRDLFYRAATELVRLALQDNKAELSLAEALAVLLRTWNETFYRYKPFNRLHLLGDLKTLIDRHQEDLEILRDRSIESFSDKDETTVKRLFRSFEEALGPVGAAKCLHLLAPQFFPLWDREIAKGYRLPLRKQGRNAERYYDFMGVTKRQCEALRGDQVIGPNLLKALDEYNYCRFTKHWI